MGLTALFEQLYNEPKKLVVLGAGCSPVSQVTARASQQRRLLQVHISPSDLTIDIDVNFANKTDINKNASLTLGRLRDFNMVPPVYV